MGYFANGTEGNEYEERVCSGCVHRKLDSGGCPIWLAHLLHAYSGSKDHHEVLDVLIPRSAKGHGNNKCSMFVDIETVTRKRREHAANQPGLFEPKPGAAR